MTITIEQAIATLRRSQAHVYSGRTREAIGLAIRGLETRDQLLAACKRALDLLESGPPNPEAVAAVMDALATAIEQAGGSGA